MIGITGTHSIIKSSTGEKEMKVSNEPPTPEEYCELRVICGLAAKTLDAARTALPRSLYTVTVRDQGKLVGMGRVVGDLGCHVQIVDIAVRPSHQKRGISHKIMKEIMKFIELNVPSCAFVNLFADVDFLYQKYGFVLGEKTKGMYLQRSTN